MKKENKVSVSAKIKYRINRRIYARLSHKNCICCGAASSLKNTSENCYYCGAAEEDAEFVNELEEKKELCGFGKTVLVGAKFCIRKWFQKNGFSAICRDDGTVDTLQNDYDYAIYSDENGHNHIKTGKFGKTTGQAISVIVPVYNTAKYLRRCLESIINQTYENLEILLINDGSTDNSLEICEEYAGKDSRIKIYSIENAGLSSAKNYGISRATSGLIGFVDSDDYISPFMFEKLEQNMREKGSDIAVCCFSVRKKETGHRVWSWKKCEARTFSNEEAVYDQFTVNVLANNSWNKLYRRELFENITFPEGRYFEDLATTYRLLLECSLISYIPDILYYKVLREGSITHGVTRIKYNDRERTFAEIAAFAGDKKILTDQEIEKLREKILLHSRWKITETYE